MTLRPKRIVTPGRIALAVALLSAAALPAAASDGGPYSMTVLVDGMPAPEYAARGRVYLEALKGKTFSIRLANPTSERVAVALSVDGRNAIDAKRTSAGAATKWILMPGQTAEIPGWQVSGDTSRRFFFTETRHSYARWLGDTSNAGVIEAVFFRERRPVAATPVWPRPILQKPSRDERSNAREGASAAEERAQAPAAAEGGVQGSVQEGVPGSPSESVTVRGDAPLLDPRSASARSKAKESDSFAATGIGDRTRFPVEWISFDEDPNPAARVSLRYEFRAQLVALGILPREDELYARDRGRGFEREYAPDPHRDR